MLSTDPEISSLWNAHLVDLDAVTQQLAKIPGINAIYTAGMGRDVHKNNVRSELRMRLLVQLAQIWGRRYPWKPFAEWLKAPNDMLRCQTPIRFLCKANGDQSVINRRLYNVMRCQLGLVVRKKTRNEQY